MVAERTARCIAPGFHATEAHQGSAAGALSRFAADGRGFGMGIASSPLARVAAREARSPSPASIYSGLETPAGIANALNRMTRR